ncbi:MAG: HEPN domain-containing protein [Candidatus Sumerlaeota bacterium]|nr:HEPN domain-containing protein [Candidatus Sumerlaeota bacterium]
MSDDLRRDLIAYRMERARATLDEARLLLTGGSLQGTVNRAYYAMFYAVQALLAERGLSRSKHASSIAAFDVEFVKTGMLNRSFSKQLHSVFRLRQNADYEDMVVVSEEQAKEAVAHAAAFVDEVEDHFRSSSS